MPNTYRIRLTPEVLNDLDEIHSHIAKNSPQNAAAMIERLFDAFDSLEQFPHRMVVEHQTPKLQYPVRSLVVRPFIVYFRVIEDEKVVVIRHIRHGARRQPKHFD